MPDTNTTTVDFDTDANPVRPIVMDPPQTPQISINLNALMKSPVTWMVIGIGIGIYLCKAKKI